MNGRAGFAAIAVLFIILALAAAGGIAWVNFVYLPSHNQPSPVPTSATSTNEVVEVATSTNPTSTQLGAAGTTSPTPKSTNSFSCTYASGGYIGVTFKLNPPAYFDIYNNVGSPSDIGNRIIAKDLSQKLFCLKVEKNGVTPVYFAEDKKDGAVLMKFVVNPVVDTPYRVDANSTAIGLVALNFTLGSSETARAQIVLTVISGDSNIPKMAAIITANENYINDSDFNSLGPATVTSVLKTLSAQPTTQIPQNTTPHFSVSPTIINMGDNATFSWVNLKANQGVFTIDCIQGITMFDVTNNASFVCGGFMRVVGGTSADTIKFTNSTGHQVDIIGQLDYGGATPLLARVTVSP